MNAYKGVALATCFAGLLAGCGGGGGGGGGGGVGTTSSSFNTALTALGLSDTYVGIFGGDGGGWGGDHGGSADSGGGAGDGEFVKISGVFPGASGTSDLTWKIIRSQYGLTEGVAGNTGTLTVTRNTDSTGGYKVTAVNGSAAAVRATQSNIFVSKSGQITGTLPLPIAGSTRDVVFTTIRFKDAASVSASPTDFSAIAGTYGFIQRAADVGTGANRSVTGGVARILANGTGRLCPGVVAGVVPTFTSTCADGMDVVLSYNLDPVTGDPLGSIINMKTAATQAVPINPSYNNDINVALVARAVTISGGAGVSISGDWLARNTVNPGTQRTGVVYMSRTADVNGLNPLTVNSSAVAGAWNLAVNAVNTAYSGTMYVGIANVGGTYKARAYGVTPPAIAGCDSPSNQRVFPSSSTNGYMAVPLQGDSNNIKYYLAIDDDTWVALLPDTAVAVGRRANATSTGIPALVGCQPV